MQGIIDADTHVSESEAMWELFDSEMYGRRPVLLSLPDDTLYGGWDKTWLIDGNIFPKPTGKGGFRLITPSAAKVQANRKDLRVACEADEDINYLAEYTGADHLITGSDYGHNDPAEQAQLVKQMRSREDIVPALIEKILCDNPKQFYRI